MPSTSLSTSSSHWDAILRQSSDGVLGAFYPDQRLVIFSFGLRDLSHELFTQGDKSQVLVPRGTSRRYQIRFLWLNFSLKLRISHEGTYSPGLFAGTSPFVCADFKRVLIFALSNSIWCPFIELALFVFFYGLKTPFSIPRFSHYSS